MLKFLPTNSNTGDKEDCSDVLLSYVSVCLFMSGSCTCIQDVEVRFSGLGPVVSLSVPTNLEMEWGKIPVLKESQKSFSLRNESGIPATVTLESVR